MIRNQWYVVLESKEVKMGKSVGATRLGEKLVLWRTPDGKAVCMRDLCPHLGARLSQGKCINERLECPFHGFQYDNKGQCRYLPAYGQEGKIPLALKVGTYPVFEGNDFIYIWWGDTPPEELEPPKFFDAIAANKKLSYCSFQQHWNVHYSRMCENQLDVMHLPFVHQTTIGRGGRTVVDGPLVRLHDGLLHVWVYNRLDDGTPPRKAEDLPEPTRHPQLEFRFPNQWHNWIGEDTHIMIAFVPVDEENGILYGRFYQGFVRLPLLSQLANLIGVWSSIVIANQDRRIVNNQVPKKTDLKMGEKIMQGDRAILTYRKHRRELQEASGQLGRTNQGQIP